jgi:hypothetical protein
MISNLSKFCRFCTILLITAVAIVAVLEPHLLVDRLTPQQSVLTGTLQLPELQQLATHTPVQAWSETGATVLPLAAQIMILRNPQGVPLDAAQKGYLRPFFGGLVDRVTVVYRAQLLDRWSQGGKETHIGGVDSSAQTYCDRIYIRSAYQPHDTDRLVLLLANYTLTVITKAAKHIKIIRSNRPPGRWKKILPVSCVIDWLARHAVASIMSTTKGGELNSP